MQGKLLCWWINEYNSLTSRVLFLCIEWKQETLLGRILRIVCSEEKT
jgi:hypothetical protein